MTVTINGTTGITTPDLESEGPISGTTGTFSGDLTLGSSTLATPTGSAPSYLCRAWVNFNGTGTVAIRASGNVSSITDNGTGDYTVNFTTAMPDANYCVQVAAKTVSSNTSVSNNSDYTTNTASQVRVAHLENATLTDTSFMHIAIFR